MDLAYNTFIPVENTMYWAMGRAAALCPIPIWFGNKLRAKRACAWPNGPQGRMAKLWPQPFKTFLFGLETKHHFTHIEAAATI